MDGDFEQYFLQALAEALTERERRIVELRYGFAGEGPQTLQQIGEVIGVSRERIRQILERAHRRLRGYCRRQIRSGRTDRACAQLLLWLQSRIRTDEAGATERVVEFIETDLGYLPVRSHALPLIIALLQGRNRTGALDLEAAAAIINEHERALAKERKRAQQEARFEALLGHAIWPAAPKPILAQDLLLQRARDVSLDGEGHPGSFESTKLGRDVQYESHMELDFLLRLEECEEVSWYQEQPLGIPYEFEGKAHSYFPDVLLVRTDGRAVIVELKPVYQMALRQNLVKWSALKKLCAAKGWGILITDGRKTIQEVQHQDADEAFVRAVMQRLEGGPIGWAEYRELRDCHEADWKDFLALILQQRLDWRLGPFKLERLASRA
jgi:DNA-binding CsgD family transcriptional regulator